MAKKTPLEFWFDFSSPYACLAATQIDALAEDHRRTVRWRPFLLGAVMKVSGGAPLAASTFKMPYYSHDFRRFSRLYGDEMTLPETFPVSTVAAARLFYWLEAQDAAVAADFAAVIFSAYFDHHRNIGEVETVLSIGEKMGFGRPEMEAALADPAVKQALRQVCDEAVERQIFGSPWIVVDGESFWGADRLWMVEEWLESGGW